MKVNKQVQLLTGSGNQIRRLCFSLAFSERTYLVNSQDVKGIGSDLAGNAIKIPDLILQRAGGLGEADDWAT